jgi:hypothetical protein
VSAADFTAQGITSLFFIRISKTNAAIKSPQSIMIVDAICPATLAA